MHDLSSERLVRSNAFIADVGRSFGIETKR